ncbi:MAG: putative baseplate assembly protein [Oculatellaceae cyanobacterium bins.114]|nr:putative baseplate assembly protein [Oculatellaceae cyanobacterium bins.114]
MEVLDADAPVEDGKKLQQQILLVHLLKPLGTVVLTQENIRIEGGDRIRNIDVIAPLVTFSDSTVVRVRVDRWGDFSTYTFRFITSKADADPPAWIDPALSAINFSFKVECPSDFDCRTPRTYPTDTVEQPDINYLSKDYASFRQLMLDRMALLIPQWQERNPADLGIALVELLAYVGDYLSYQQDSITTEAYLGTARRRTSIRRHARLVDYFMHDGCNARVWIQIQVNSTKIELPRYSSTTKIRTRFLTRFSNEKLIAPERLQQVISNYPCIGFEPLHDITLYKEHNILHFYTWSSDRCCLPKGATRATLKGNYPNLRSGMVLIFQEVLGPETGVLADANPAHRHAVCLTAVRLRTDPVVLDPNDNQPLKLTEITWSAEDALPFPLCISSVRLDSEGNRQLIPNVSIALGNIVLADHGLTQERESLRDGHRDRFPPISLHKVSPNASKSHCDSTTPIPIPPRFRPQLQKRSLTYAVPFTSVTSTTAAMQQIPDAAQGAIKLDSTLDGESLSWFPIRSLLGADIGSNQTVFIPETETDGTTFLRFGDDVHGRRPESGMQFVATYRIGNGTIGNVGANAIAHLVSANSALTETDLLSITNPLPAQGGTNPETIEEVRQRAPSAFRSQERAVTPEDYAAWAERFPGVQRAAATLRWTGSWYTVFVTVDRFGRAEVDDEFNEFKTRLQRYLERYRMMGHDLKVEAPVYVPLEIEMQVCIKPGYFASTVKQALLEIFSDRILANGQRGIFHPDQFSFGQTVYLSPLYAAAQAVDGVASAKITVFQRQGKPDSLALENGKLELERLEIAQLENNPNYPDRGVFRILTEGGR